MALHALAYCQRLFYLEEVEEIRVADHRVFAGRQLHARLEAKEDGKSMSLDLASESLGLLGKVDCLRRRDGSYLPYEHKRGLPARHLDGTPEAWLPDRLQLIAYAVLLEETFGCPIPEGRVRYHAANVTVRVPIDDRAKIDLRDAIAEAQRLRETVERPPITDNPRLCQHCSLAPVCLPEEVRQDRDPEHDPVRLFPQDRDGTTLHVVAQGTSVGVSRDSLVVKQRDGPDVKHPARSIETLLLHGFTQVSTQAIRKCVEYGIGVHWLSVSGSHTASLVPTAGQVQRRIRQYQALTTEDTCLRLAKQLTSAKVEGQYRYLMRASRGNGDRRSDIQMNLNSIQPLLDGILVAGDRDSLRGLEGLAAVHYFAALRKLLGRRVHDDLRSDSRSRKPPQDRFNACLSYGLWPAKHGCDGGDPRVWVGAGPRLLSHAALSRISSRPRPYRIISRDSVGHAAGRFAESGAVGSGHRFCRHEDESLALRAWAEESHRAVRGSIAGHLEAPGAELFAQLCADYRTRSPVVGKRMDR